MVQVFSVFYFCFSEIQNDCLQNMVVAILERLRDERLYSYELEVTMPEPPPDPH